MKRILFGSPLVLIIAAFLGPNFLSKSQALPVETSLPHIDQSQYVGSKKCAECHPSYYESWKDSAHNKMIRPAIAAGPNKTVPSNSKT